VEEADVAARDRRGDLSSALASGDVESDLVETGVPNLDPILGGGLPRTGLALVVGPPGSGKTTLAQQIAFHRATLGESVLFLTGFSETHDKLLRLGRSLQFFDPERVGTAIHFGSLPDLLRDGSESAEDAILSTVRSLGARLVVLDGFRALGPLLGGEETQAGVRFLYHLGTKLGLLGATTLVLMEGDSRELASPAELGLADALIALQLETRYGRDRRVLQVRKRRGGRPLAGVHPYEIDARGVHVWRRFESSVHASEPVWSTRRAAFRKPPIDELLHGGLPEGTVTLAAGSFGTGKTLLGLHFAAEGARLGEPTLVLGFMESAAQLRAQGRIFNLELEEYERSGMLRIMTLPAHDLEADCVAELLREEIERRGVRRLVIDSAAQLERSIVDTDRRPDFFAALVTYLRGRAVTTYLTYEIARYGSELDLAETSLAVLAENLLLLQTVEADGRLRRLFSIMHMRFSDHDHRLHRYTIEAGQGMLMRGETPTGPAPAFSAQADAADTGDHNGRSGSRGSLT
jgi:circadian clock protein KaiC